jgi:hypothetical protein
MWSREWLLTLARPRSVVVKLAMPLILGVPLVAGRAPTFWAGMLLTVLVAMVGAVGSAMTLARARQSGLLSRLAMSPRSAWRVLGGVIAAGVVVDLIQLLPVVVTIAIAGAGLDTISVLGLAMLAALLVGHLLGCLVAALAGGVAEVLLDVSVLLAPLLFLGGIFTGVPREGWRAAVAVADPFGELHSAWISALGGTAAFSPLTIVAVAGVSIALCVAGLAALCRPLLERR